MALRNILIVALGGEGGGVLADWIVHAAHASGLPVQATSVPGVAQRTGATSYYIEYADRVPPAGSAAPVFALTPVPGAVDVVLASELMEAGRAIERGFVSPERTLLVTARHRVLTTQEKLAMGDGRFDEQRLVDAAHGLAARCLALPLREIAQQHGTVISAVMFGALAGSGRLPWPREACEAAIREGGVGVAASLAGFAAAFAAARADDASADPLAGSAASDARPASPALHHTLELGRARLLDYQDAAYVRRYDERIARLQRAAGGDARAEAAVVEAARWLALWMSYEDVIRVADLKTRASRLARVRAEAQAGAADLVQVREHLKPGLEEMAAIAPRAVGRWLLERARPAAAEGLQGRSLTLRTTTVTGFALLRLLAMLRRWRPGSLRFAQEQTAIDTWVAALERVLTLHPGTALQLAELPRLRKGYGETMQRGLRAYERVFAGCVAPLLDGRTSIDAAAEAGLRAAMDAALADPEHRALDGRLGAGKGAAAAPRPITFMPRPAAPPPPANPRP